MSNFSYPQVLIDNLKTKECVIFVGSGASTWSGAPSWSKLLLDFLDFIKYRGLCNQNEETEILNHIKNGELLISASLCKSLVNESEFSEFIDNEFVRKDFSPSEIHEIIINLGQNCFVTTNYDDLIENAFQKTNNGIILKIINNNQPIEQAGIQKHSSSRFIFKIHGMMQMPSTIILTQEDYRRLRVNMNSTIATLQNLLVQRPVIYIGFGLKDPTFFLIKDYIAEVYGGGGRQHFAIMPDVSTLQKKFWHDSYGITLINYETSKHIEIDKNTGAEKITIDHTNLLKLLRKIRTDYTEADKISAIQVDKIKLDEKLSLLRYCDSLAYEHSLRSVKSFSLNVKSLPVNQNYFNELDNNEFGKTHILDSVLTDFKKLTIIGEPGSGKSFALNNFAYTIASKTRSSTGKFDLHSIPVVLPFKEYQGNIMEMFTAKLPTIVDKELTLNEGYYTIILDAINEAPKVYFETKALEKDVSEFIKLFAKNKFIVSARTENYISFLDFPRFQIQRLRDEVVSQELAGKKINAEDIPDQAYHVLSNPFLLQLFLSVNVGDIANLRNPTTLLEYYFNANRNNMKSYGFDIDIKNVFSSFSYKLTEIGAITADPKELLDKLNLAYEPIISQEILNTLISIKFLVPDSEGNVGFVHQIILEYLSACHLVSIYETDQYLIHSNINNPRWDETMMLFVSMLDTHDSRLIIKKIADKDIFFGFSVFDSATFQDNIIKETLFEELFNRIEYKKVPTGKKEMLGWYFYKYDVPTKFIPKLVELVGDKHIGDEVSLALSKLGYTEIIPEVIDNLFTQDISLPSGYSRALIQFNDNRIVNTLIDLSKKIKDINDGELLLGNLSFILAKYDLDEVMSKIQKLSLSKNRKYRIISAKLIEAISSPRKIEIIITLLRDEDEEIQKEAISSLNHYDWENGKTKLKDSRIVDISFEKLKNAVIGDVFSTYLKDLEDDEIYAIAENKIFTTSNQIEKINLSNIILQKKPQIFREIILESLHNYDESLNQVLHNALFLNFDTIKDDILELFNKRKLELTKFIISTFSNESSEIVEYLDLETCQYLFEIWEKNIIKKSAINDPFLWHVIFPNFLASKHLYDRVIEKLNDENYSLREQLVPAAARLKIRKSQLKPETLNWLLNKMYVERRHFGKASDIIIQIADEKFTKNTLIPMLDSDNPKIVDNIYDCILKIEKKLNKRLTKK